MSEPAAQDPATVMAHRALALVQQMDQNPEAKALLDKAIKAVRPEHQTEEELALRTAAPFIERVEAVSTQMQEFLNAQKEREERQAEERTVAQLEQDFAALAKRGYTGEGLEKIKELMVTRKIADPTAAALLFDSLNPAPPSEAPGYVPQTWDLSAAAGKGEDDLKMLFQNEDRWEQNKIGEVLNEIRLGKAA